MNITYNYIKIQYSFELRYARQILQNIELNPLFKQKPIRFSGILL